MNRQLIVYLVSFAAFLGPFTQTIYAPILPEIQSDFRTSQFLVNLSISIFTIFLALMQMIYGPLTDTKGRRTVLLPGIALYVAASFGCAYSHSITQLLLFRMIQAIGIATGTIVATTVISDLFTGKSRGRAMGTFQMLMALGPVLGPVIGGFVGGKTGYHGVFLVLTATGLLMLVANASLLPETKPDSATDDRFQIRDFYSILTHKTGLPVILLGFVQYYTFYNFLVFLPDILTSHYNLRAEEKGIVFLPLSLFLVIGSYLGGRLQEKVEARKSLIVTSFLNVFATLMFILSAKISLASLIVNIALFGLFLGLSLPVQTTLLTEFFTRQRATAIGVYNFFRYMGMASGPFIGSYLYQLGHIPLLYGFAALVFFAVVLYTRRQLMSGHTLMASGRGETK
ncbi:MFS transporter [Collibacillus ludicampi]|uniref:MFS transporter n=1 Tax=Collibacillus ludicampi TaxID=2771369 RepID=A0AAV4LBS8_9BACL|nr:MFS transporter [Collibacillus ludicampi]GIM45159.1 MFS transporter [Collibacillus ludicampi]